MTKIESFTLQIEHLIILLKNEFTLVSNEAATELDGSIQTTDTVKASPSSHW